MRESRGSLLNSGWHARTDSRSNDIRHKNFTSIDRNLLVLNHKTNYTWANLALSEEGTRVWGMKRHMNEDAHEEKHRDTTGHEGITKVQERRSSPHYWGKPVGKKKRLGKHCWLLTLKYWFVLFFLGVKTSCCRISTTNIRGQHD